MIRRTTFLLLASVVLAPAGRAATLQSRPGFDEDAAARYLDDRMDLWFEKAKRLRTGEGKTSCVSCHMSVPYALARPALRRSRGELPATTQETRLIEETARRVTSPDTLEPLYADQPRASEGTEAVLNALILAGDDASANRSRPGAPTRQAFRRLWAVQQSDGAWSWLNFALEPNESAEARYHGATLAALAVAMVPGARADDEVKPAAAVAKLATYLRENYPRQSLHHRVWLLLASTRFEGLLAGDPRDALIAELVRVQNRDGGWSLYGLGPWTGSGSAAQPPPANDSEESLRPSSDGYATGLVTYTLRRAGLPLDARVVKRATEWLAANQKEVVVDGHRWRCWQAGSLNKVQSGRADEGEPWQRMFMSDGATAFAVLALLPPD